MSAIVNTHSLTNQFTPVAEVLSGVLEREKKIVFSPEMLEREATRLWGYKYRNQWDECSQQILVLHWNRILENLGSRPIVPLSNGVKLFRFIDREMIGRVPLLSALMSDFDKDILNDVPEEEQLSFVSSLQARRRERRDKGLDAFFQVFSDFDPLKERTQEEINSMVSVPQEEEVDLFNLLPGLEEDEDFPMVPIEYEERTIGLDFPSSGHLSRTNILPLNEEDYYNFCATEDDEDAAADFGTPAAWQEHFKTVSKNSIL